MFLIGTSLFIFFAANLLNNSPLIQTDARLAGEAHQFALHSSPVLRTVAISGFYLGEHVIFAIGAGLILYFLAKRFWPELCMVVIAWPGELVLLFLLSPYFHRARPLYDVSVWRNMPSPGFPSGHSISVIMCYGLLAYLLVPKIQSHRGKAAVIVAAIVISIFVGISRIYVGDHYPVDVLAGYSLGIAWSGLVYTSVELIARRKRVGEQVVRSYSGQPGAT